MSNKFPTPLPSTRNNSVYPQLVHEAVRNFWFCRLKNLEIPEPVVRISPDLNSVVLHLTQANSLFIRSPYSFPTYFFYDDDLLQIVVSFLDESS